MDFRVSLLNELLGCALCVAVLVWRSWRPNAVTVGIPLCYMLSLGMIHVAGAAIHTLPWMQVSWSGTVALGFTQCFHGIVSFTAAIVCFDVITLNRKDRRRGALTSSSSNLGASWTHRPTLYLATAITLQIAFGVALRDVPSIGAVASGASALLVAAICLAVASNWMAGNRLRTLQWAGSAVLLPVYTMGSMGFLGMGAAAAAVILVFSTVLYRPRWQSLMVFAIAVYLGLSLFVTYMRDRVALREALSDTEDYSASRAPLAEMFTSFEFFDPWNELHLARIDERLNQNYLVGVAEANILNGDVPLAHGDTIVDALIALVPRIFWPNKPVRAGSPMIVSQYTGIEFAESTSVGIGQVMEFYINFGDVGVVAGFIVVGTILWYFDRKAASALARRDDVEFVAWFVPSLAFLQTGGSLIEVTSTAAASGVLVGCIRYFARQNQARIVSKRTADDVVRPNNDPTSSARS